MARPLEWVSPSSSDVDKSNREIIISALGGAIEGRDNKHQKER